MKDNGKVMQEIKQWHNENKIRMNKSDNSFVAVNNPFIVDIAPLIIPQIL